MTADAFSDDVRKCLDAGMNGHIAKPIEPETLYRIPGISWREASKAQNFQLAGKTDPDTLKHEEK